MPDATPPSIPPETPLVDGLSAVADSLGLPDSESSASSLSQYHSALNSPTQCELLNAEQEQGERDDRISFSSEYLSDLIARAEFEPPSSLQQRAAEADMPAVQPNASEFASNKELHATETKQQPVAAADDDSVKTRNVYINGLPPNFRDDQLLAIATNFGEVDNVRCLTRNGPGAPTGYGFVLFKTIAAAEKCIKTLKRSQLHPSFSKVNKPPRVVASPSSLSLPASCSSSSQGSADHDPGSPVLSFKEKMARLEDKQSANVYIEGLPMSADKNTLLALVHPHTILSSRFIRSKIPNSPTMIAFMRMETRAAAEAVITLLDGETVCGWDGAESRVSLRIADTLDQRELRRAETAARDGEDLEFKRLSMAGATLLSYRAKLTHSESSGSEGVAAAVAPATVPAQQVPGPSAEKVHTLLTESRPDSGAGGHGPALKTVLPPQRSLPLPLPAQPFSPPGPLSLQDLQFLQSRYQLQRYQQSLQRTQFEHLPHHLPLQNHPLYLHLQLQQLAIAEAAAGMGHHDPLYAPYAHVSTPPVFPGTAAGVPPIAGLSGIANGVENRLSGNGNAHPDLNLNMALLNLNLNPNLVSGAGFPLVGLPNQFNVNATPRAIPTPVADSPILSYPTAVTDAIFKHHASAGANGNVGAVRSSLACAEGFIAQGPVVKNAAVGNENRRMSAAPAAPPLGPSSSRRMSWQSPVWQHSSGGTSVAGAAVATSGRVPVSNGAAKAAGTAATPTSGGVSLGVARACTGVGSPLKAVTVARPRTNTAATTAQRRPLSVGGYPLHLRSPLCNGTAGAASQISPVKVAVPAHPLARVQVAQQAIGSGRARARSFSATHTRANTAPVVTPPHPACHVQSACLAMEGSANTNTNTNTNTSGMGGTHATNESTNITTANHQNCTAVRRHAPDVKPLASPLSQPMKNRVFLGPQNVIQRPSMPVS